MRSINDSIPADVLTYAEEHAESIRRFISYIEKFGEEIIQRTFAYKKPKGKDLLITEILRAVSGQDRYLCKNLYFTGLGGYQAVFRSEARTGRYNYITYFDPDDFDVWYDLPGSLPCIANTVLNPELLKETKYRYCAYEECSYSYGLIDYLKLYNEYPHLELLSKLGIQASKQLLKMTSKDKQFCKFLSLNKAEVHNHGIPATVYAYRHNIPISEAKTLLNISRELSRDMAELKDTKLDKAKLRKYLQANKIDYTQYNDYLKAIKYLKLDLKDTKNIFPKEFRRMHDLRVSQYESATLKETLKGKRELNKKFKNVANDYSSLNLDGVFCVMIATDIKDLIIEGNRLHHCVGKMGYDAKMANRESLILFVREKGKINIPYVTLEYSLKQKRVMQIYGDHDSTPKKEVLDFVNKVWLKHAKTQLKKIAA